MNSESKLIKQAIKATEASGELSKPSKPATTKLDPKGPAKKTSGKFGNSDSMKGSVKGGGRNTDNVNSNNGWSTRKPK